MEELLKILKNALSENSEDRELEESEELLIAYKNVTNKSEESIKFYKEAVKLLNNYPELKMDSNFKKIPESFKSDENPIKTLKDIESKSIIYTPLIEEILDDLDKEDLTELLSYALSGEKPEGKEMQLMLYTLKPLFTLKINTERMIETEKKYLLLTAGTIKKLMSEKNCTIDELLEDRNNLDEITRRLFPTREKAEEYEKSQIVKLKSIVYSLSNLVMIDTQVGKAFSEEIPPEQANLPIDAINDYFNKITEIHCQINKERFERIYG